ncbi:MAG: hypothetical protein OEZ13_11615 [Spirochaetia bacterium]|nr:hypothetical protein [Spirochaetia bacterium]
MTNILPSTCKENPFYFIIQARLSSKRLPEKVLKNIGSQNLLDHIIYRLTRLQIRKISLLLFLMATIN